MISRRTFAAGLAAATVASLTTGDAIATTAAKAMRPVGREYIFKGMRVTDIDFGMLEPRVVNGVTRFGLDRTTVKVTMRNYRNQEHNFSTEDPDIVREMRELLESQEPLTVKITRTPLVDDTDDYIEQERRG